MANIIEREIAKRKAVISSKEEKELEITMLKEQIAGLEKEVNAIDVPTLEEEIAELETYLPKADNAEAETTDETVAEAPTMFTI